MKYIVNRFLILWHNKKTKSLIVFWFLCQCLLAQNNNLPGDLNEQFKVSQNGGTSFTIPIEAPPGIQHLQPNIKLIYNSQTSNGLLGVGWDLIGIPSIQRAKRIRAVDRVSGTISYNNEDKYSFTGQRLINISGDYGGDSTQYHTEIESWCKFTSYGKSGEGPQSFVMKSKKGEVFEFGKTANSRVIADTSNISIRTWLLEKVTDLNGNSLTIQYSKNPLDNDSLFDNRLYPIEIAYTSNENQQYKGNRFVCFVYEERSDVETIYMGGYPITTSIRLAAIETYIGTIKVNSYQLSYEMSPSTNRSLISMIQRCSGNSNSICLSPVKLNYQKGVEAFDSLQNWGNEFTKQNGWDGSNQPFTLSDVNGDGFLDVVGFGTDSLKVALSNGKKFSPSKSWSTQFTLNDNWTQDMSRLLADVNGDGMADVIGFGSSGVQVGISTGHSFNTEDWKELPYFGIQQNWTSSTPIELADVNNDGLTDIVGFGIDGVMVSLSTGTEFSTPIQWTKGFTLSENWTQDMPRLLADFNGDGMADIIGFGTNGVQVGISTGDSFDTELWDKLPYFGNQQNWTSSTPRMVADVNSDGLTDIIGFGLDSVMISLSTGKGFTKPVSWTDQFTLANNWTSAKPRMLGDVNGDGFLDIVGVGTTNVQVGISTGSSFELKNWDQNSLSDLSISSAGGQESTTRIVDDINGDGLADLVGFGIKNTMTGLSAGPKPDLANHITRSTGANYEITYAPLSDSEVYSSDNNHIQSRNSSLLPLNSGSSIPQYRSASMLGGYYYVAKNYSITSSDQKENHFEYAYIQHYENAVLNLEGRGWMGFNKVKTTKDNNIKLVEYKQKYPFTGKESQISLLETDTIGNSVDTVMVAIQQLAAIESVTAIDSSQKIQFVYIEADRILNYDKGEYAHATGKKYAYDNFGNPNKVTYQNLINIKDGSSVEPSKNIYLLSNYANDSINWRLGYPLYHKVTKNDIPVDIDSFYVGTDFSLHSFRYNTVNENMISQSQWDNVHNQFLTTNYDFDAFGNRTDVIQPSGATYTIDYDTVYNTYPKSWKSPQNEFGKNLEEQYSFDPRFGELAISVNYNGHPSIYTYDDFGRKILEQIVSPDYVPESSLSTPKTPSFLTPIDSSLISEKVLTIDSLSYGWENQMPVQKSVLLASWPSGTEQETIWSKSYIDGLGRVYKASVQDPFNSGRVITNLQFDSRNQIIMAALPHFENDSAQYMNISYDILQRVILMETPTDNGTNKLSSTNYLATSTGFNEVKTEAAGTDYAYQQTMQYNYFANEAKMSRMQSANDTTNYEYDLVGRITDIIAPEGQDGTRLSNSYTYDALGRVVTKQTPSRGDFHFHYDQNDLLSEQLQANGSITFLHDSLGRVLRETYANEQQVQYVYDNPEVKNGLGQMTAALSYKDSNKLESSNHFQFDNYGGVISDSLFIAGTVNKSFLTQYQVDLLGRPIVVINPDSSQIVYSYNGIDLTSITQENTSVKYSNYTVMGIPTTTEYGNGVNTTYDFSVEGNINKIETSSKEQTVFNKSYDWNNLNQLTGIHDAISNDSIAYSYENLRLTSENAKEYQYDDAGNIIDKQGTTYQYDGDTWTDAQTQNGEQYHASYDTMGNMTLRILSEDTTVFSFDSRNKLVAAQKTGDTDQANYIYDYKGTRIYKSTPNGEVEYYVNPMFSQKVIDGAVTNIKTPKGLFGTFAQINTSTNKPIYLQTNHQGSTVLLTDENGNTLGKVNYSPYGEITGNDTLQVNAQYTGWEFDEYTELYYMNYRYYDPKSGNFISADNVFGGAISRQDALNDYAYVLNSPLVFVDPDGHSPEDFYNTGIALIANGVIFLVLEIFKVPYAESIAMITTGISFIIIYHISKRRRAPINPLKKRDNDKDDEEDPDSDINPKRKGFHRSNHANFNQSVSDLVSENNQTNTENNVPSNTNRNISNLTSYNSMSTISSWSAIKNTGYATAGIGLVAGGVSKSVASTYEKTTKGIASDGAKAGEAGEAAAETEGGAGIVDSIVEFIGSLFAL
jgi:RHS repeat-associated protein